MANTPIRILTFRQIVRLHCQGAGLKTIHGLIGTSRNTIKKYICIWEALGITHDEFKGSSDAQLYEWFCARNSKGVT